MMLAAGASVIDHPSGIRYVVDSKSAGDEAEDDLDALDRQIERKRLRTTTPASSISTSLPS